MTEIHMVSKLVRWQSLTKPQCLPYVQSQESIYQLWKHLSQLNSLSSRTNTGLGQDKMEKNISELFYRFFFFLVICIYIFNKYKIFHYFTQKSIHLKYLAPRNGLAFGILARLILLCYVPGCQFLFTTALSPSLVVIGIPQNLLISCKSYFKGLSFELKGRK